MINVSKARNLLLKKHPGLTVTLILDYDKEWYVIEALEDKDKIYVDPSFYGVNKENGLVTYFSPGGDFDKFFDALDNRVLYRSKGD